MFREDLSRNFGFLLHDVSRLMRTTFDRRVKGLGFTRSQWWVLTHLFRMGGATQSELAEVLEVEKPTLGRLLDRLEAKGWVRREADAADRRVKRLYLTDEVEPTIKAMRAVAAEVRRQALAGLSPEEQERFVDTLLRLKANLSGAEIAARRNGGNGARTGARQGASGVAAAGGSYDANGSAAAPGSGVARGRDRGGGSATRELRNASREGNSGAREVRARGR
jgi:DNA-binding MarR family transcriptional regulator